MPVPTHEHSRTRMMVITSRLVCESPAWKLWIIIGLWESCLEDVDHFFIPEQSMPYSGFLQIPLFSSKTNKKRGLRGYGSKYSFCSENKMTMHAREILTGRGDLYTGSTRCLLLNPLKGNFKVGLMIQNLYELI